MRGSIISLFIALAVISFNSAAYAGEKKVQSDVVEESQNAEEAVNSATKK